MEINVKLAEKNEFAAHFVQKCLETRENEQNVVLNESSKALGNHSKIVRILVLAMTTESSSNEDGNVNENVAKQWIKLQNTITARQWKCNHLATFPPSSLETERENLNSRVL